MGFPNNDQAGVGMALENVGEQRAGSLTSRVGVNYVNLSFGRFERAKIRGKSGLELLGDDLEILFGQNALELAQHKRMRREQADGKLR
jgi:hypothetical protein